MALNRAEFVGKGDVLVQRAHEDMHVRTVWGTTACLSRPYLFGLTFELRYHWNLIVSWLGAKLLHVVGGVLF